jgi:hypothetical protein
VVADAIVVIQQRGWTAVVVGVKLFEQISLRRTKKKRASVERINLPLGSSAARSAAAAAAAAAAAPVGGFARGMLPRVLPSRPQLACARAQHFSLRHSLRNRMYM